MGFICIEASRVCSEGICGWEELGQVDGSDSVSGWEELRLIRSSDKEGELGQIGGTGEITIIMPILNVK